MLETHEECIVYLEKLRWNGIPTCPYCSSIKSTRYKKEFRYRCNTCFTSYSVTVGTLFHKTHIGLDKWFRAIVLLYTVNRDISIRGLARELQVNRATATLISERIFKASSEQKEMLRKIVQSFETQNQG